MKEQIPNMWKVSNSICHHQFHTLSDVDWFQWVFWRILILNRESLCEVEMNVHCSSQSISCLTMFLCWNIHSICHLSNDLKFLTKISTCFWNFYIDIVSKVFIQHTLWKNFKDINDIRKFTGRPTFWASSKKYFVYWWCWCKKITRFL
jgi:hypothetical protein